MAINLPEWKAMHMIGEYLNKNTDKCNLPITKMFKANNIQFTWIFIRITKHICSNRELLSPNCYNMQLRILNLNSKHHFEGGLIAWHAIKINGVNQMMVQTL